MNFDVILFDELKDIFCCRKVSILKDTLDRQSIPYICDSKGNPMVLREALNKRLRESEFDPPSPTP